MSEVENEEEVKEVTNWSPHRIMEHLQGRDGHIERRGGKGLLIKGE